MPEAVITNNWVDTIKQKFSDSNLKNENIDFLSIFENITSVHQKQLESEKVFETNVRKHFGIYYTPYSIAKKITENTLKDDLGKSFFLNAKFLEPCMGSGIFVIAYIDYLFERFLDWSNDELQIIINNIYGADIDPKGIKIFQKFFPIYLQSKYGKVIYLKEENFYFGDLLFRINDNGDIEKNSPKNCFENVGVFDLILTNPPYKLLKANVNKYGVGNAYSKEIKQIINFIKANKTYNFNTGTLNLYKLFVEEIFENYSSSNARIGLLIPQTFLNDKQSEKLRKRVFFSSSVSEISILNEKNDFFTDITQSFCFFSAHKGKCTNSISLKPNIVDECSLNKNSVDIDIKLIANLSDTFPIIYEENIGWKILDKLQKYKKVKQLPYLVNARGELDLTLNKAYIIEEETKYPLLRGVNIKEFFTTQGDTYASEDFLSAINGKQKFIKEERIICQQISNMNSYRRLKFAKISNNIVLGNSCNFISLKNTLIKPPFSLDYLLGVLNSRLLDWRFRITSSNNHINNYELDELPIPIPNKKQLIEIELLTNKILNFGNNDELYENLNDLIYDLYGLEKKEIEYINNKYI
jgi:adenine-specific DNA-methyltransferase